MPELTISRDRIRTWRILRLSGEIDMLTVKALRAELRDAVAEGPAGVVVDLTDVEFCDAHGFGALVAARRRARSVGGELRLVHPLDDGTRAVDAGGLSQLFRTYASVHEATSSR